jgi:c-di-GMP phosphodiesterase
VNWRRCSNRKPRISYRLLRYLNSPLFGFALEIKSIRHAMAVLGEREMRRWIRLVVTVGAAEQQLQRTGADGIGPRPFLRTALEPAAIDSDLFLLGLLSIMDAILEVSMEVLLEQLPVDHETKAVLLGQNERSPSRSTNSCWPRNRGSGSNRAELAKATETNR